MAQEITTATTDEAALQSLLAGPSTQLTSVSELARQWGWNRTRVRRRLSRWSADGLIARAIEGDGRSTITLVAGTVNVAVMAAPADVSIVDTRPLDAPPSTPLSRPAFSLQLMGALAIGALALAIAYFGLQINSWYGASLGRDAQAAALLAGLAITGDAVALLLPTVAQLVRSRLEKFFAWAVWLLTLTIAVMAAVGFAATNISDTSAGRAKVANELASLTTQVARLEAERARINIKPAAVQGLGNYRAEVTRANAIEAQLTAARARLAALPAVTTADPQADMAASLLRWVSGGFIQASAADVGMFRIIGMTLLPQISGLLLMLAAGLWRENARNRHSR